jgi:hypothetical protein
MDEEFDTVIHPHPPLPLPHMRYQNHFEVDPIRIDPIIDIVVRLDPINVHISRIGLSMRKLPSMNMSSIPASQYALTAARKPFKGQRRRGVNPNRLPISSSVAL